MTNDTTMKNKVRSNTMNNNVRSNTITGRHLWLPPKQGYYEWSASWSQVSKSQHYRDVTPTLLQWTVCVFDGIWKLLYQMWIVLRSWTHQTCALHVISYTGVYTWIFQWRKLVYIEFNPLCNCFNHICTQQIWSISLLI